MEYMFKKGLCFEIWRCNDLTNIVLKGILSEKCVELGEYCVEGILCVL